MSFSQKIAFTYLSLHHEFSPCESPRLNSSSKEATYESDSGSFAVHCVRFLHSGSLDVLIMVTPLCCYLTDIDGFRWFPEIS